MREAMASAEVGDDVFGEDPTVNELQKKCASLFGKEDALFVPTGTMGNLISVMTHCRERGLEAILGTKSHIFIHEQGGISQVAGVLASTIENNPDGTFDIDKIKERIRLTDDPHFPYTRLICLENTQNMCGGKVLPMSFMQDVYGLASELGLKVHLDGARLMNAATALNVPPSEILKYVDSASMCFSKGLACPVGSIIAGTKPFIKQAKRTRKLLGGGMRQAGVLAAAALYSIDNIIPRLHIDHQHAQMLAKGKS
ncbi:hypothetical protein KUTeg_003493 [Tegillarca granosa]|uniref:Aromatic amino acid beta-eliminating lyase/threonine aldolase domain-containing protein n=1 Tax=Tegillarca granosa TaxID=220873 RepID=A0ABQ9FR42_TEGGR|nr:hypothetical protein KUTeg_003493 [Tegillarca granosa]